MITSDHIRLLGQFIPSRLDATVLMHEIKPFLPPCCARERISVREPDERTVPHPNNLEWHQDGEGPKGTVRHMVVWATEDPTQLRLSDGIEFQPAPYEVVWFNNDVIWHRQPRDTNEGSRWFASVRCSGSDYD